MSLGQGISNTVYGGAGADTIFLGNTNSSVLGEGGNDFVTGVFNTASLLGGTGDDLFFRSTSSRVASKPVPATTPSSSATLLLTSTGTTVLGSTDSETLISAGGGISASSILGYSSADTIVFGLVDGFNRQLWVRK